MFKNFGKRLQRDIKRRVDKRLEENIQAMGIQEKDRPDPLKVSVVSHRFQRYAVWFGGSIMSMRPGFHEVCHTRAQYLEEGPRIARHNAAFNTTM